MWYLWVCIALSRSTPAFRLPYQNNIALHDNDNEDDDDDDDLVKIYTCIKVFQQKIKAVYFLN